MFTKDCNSSIQVQKGFTMKRMTEDEVFEYYQNGLPDDFKLDKSKIIRKKYDLSKATVQISVELEYDLLSELKEEADKKQLPYQTLMKQIIKDHLSKVKKGA